MYPKNSGGCSKFPGRLKFRPSIAQTAFVRVVTPRIADTPGCRLVPVIARVRSSGSHFQSNLF